jgi:hypothetical protein
MSKRHGGELLWILNLVRLGVGGVLLIPLDCMGWDYGRIFLLISENFIKKA